MQSENGFLDTIKQKMPRGFGIPRLQARVRALQLTKYMITLGKGLLFSEPQRSGESSRPSVLPGSRAARLEEVRGREAAGQSWAQTVASLPPLPTGGDSLKKNLNFLTRKPKKPSQVSLSNRNHEGATLLLASPLWMPGLWLWTPGLNLHLLWPVV